MLFVFQTFFTEKGGENFKYSSPLFQVEFRVKKLEIKTTMIHAMFSPKIQLAFQRFFTEKVSEKLKFSSSGIQGIYFCRSMVVQSPLPLGDLCSLMASR
jgi:hypothetical protein